MGQEQFDEESKASKKKIKENWNKNTLVANLWGTVNKVARGQATSLRFLSTTINVYSCDIGKKNL